MTTIPRHLFIAVRALSFTVISSIGSAEAAGKQIIADAAHGSVTGIEGGSWMSDGFTPDDAALIASGKGYEIQGSGLEIMLNPAVVNIQKYTPLVVARQGAAITLDKTTLTQGTANATGNGSQLFLSDSTINLTAPGNAIDLSQKASGVLNDLRIKGNMNNALFLSGNSSAEIDKLSAEGGMTLYGSNLLLKNSVITPVMNISHGLALNDGSTATLENSDLLAHGDSSGVDARDSTLSYNHGTITGGYAGISLIHSQLTGSQLTISGGDTWGVKATGDSQLALSDDSTINGGLLLGYGYASDGSLDKSSAELTDVTIHQNGLSNTHGIWVGGKGSLTMTRGKIDTLPEGSYGVWFPEGGSRQRIADSTISTHGKSAIAVYMAGNKTNREASHLDLSNSQLTTEGDSASGFLLRRYNERFVTTSTLNDVSITTQGSKGSAIGVMEGAALSGNNVTVDARGESTAALNLSRGTADRINTVNLTDSQLISQRGIGLAASGYADIDLSNSRIGGNSALLLVRSAEKSYPTTVVNARLSHTQASGDTVVSGNSQLNMQLQNASVLSGSIHSAAFTLKDSRWNISGDSELTRLDNSGTIAFSGKQAGRTLKVNGDYIASNGNLSLNSVLGGDDSATDKLVVSGNTQGHTRLSINPVGGDGAQTTNGINVVQVAGASEGTFTLNNRVTAGGYEYFLHKGDAAGDGGDWYLRSEVNEQPSPAPDPGENPGPGPAPAPPPGPRAVVEPEAAAYIASQSIANTLFNLSLHDRLGQTQPLTATDETPAAFWLRTVGAHDRSRVASGRLQVKSNSGLVQLGSDLLRLTMGNSRAVFGLMGGYGHVHLSSRSRQDNYGASGNVNGYSVGAYASWFADRHLQQEGLYVDSWLQYNWFHNRINGDGRRTVRYTSSGFSASLESGYTLKIHDYPNSRLYLQPQAQLLWSAVNASAFNDGYNSRIDGGSPNYWRSRLGARLYLRMGEKPDEAPVWQPFIEANWLHNNKTYAVDYKMHATRNHFASDNARDSAEIKLGLEGQLSRNLTVWGDAGEQFDGNQYSRITGMLGIKYLF